MAVVVVVVVAVALVLSGTARLSKSFEVSTRVMKAMNNMVSMRTVSDTMKELEKEMLKVIVLLAFFFVLCFIQSKGKKAACVIASSDVFRARCAYPNPTYPFLTVCACACSWCRLV
jgi:hypothetical protein